MGARNHARKAVGPRQLDRMSESDLLRVRFKDLRLDLCDSLLADDLSSLHDDLLRRDLRFRPHAWLSTEWFSPDGIPGIAVPFYLAHPRLRRLEQKMVGEAEGGSRNVRKRILRHEAGHAIDTAFGLRRRRHWREMFGRASKRYPSAYLAKPGSRRHVQHLGHWYAQSHPTEDFAETFAVWLQPKARWRRDYRGWPALEKLEYVDELMLKIAGQLPANRKRDRVATLADNNRTLAAHYRHHRRCYDPLERRYDRWLQREFAASSARPRAVPAARYVEAIRPELRRRLLSETPAGGYLIDQTLQTVLRRARELGLVLRGPRSAARPGVLRLLRRIVLDILKRNREMYVL